MKVNSIAIRDAPERPWVMVGDALGAFKLGRIETKEGQRILEKAGWVLCESRLAVWLMVFQGV